MNNLAYRDQLKQLENVLLGLPQVELETQHYYAEGTYTRVLHLPKDTILTGKIHRFSCINILAKGKIKVVTDESDYNIEAPYIFVSGPLVKKAGYVIEDAVWINVHPWDGKMNLEQIENTVIVSEQLEYREPICLG